MKRHVKNGRMRQMKLRQRQNRYSPIERIFRRWFVSSRRRLQAHLEIVSRLRSTLKLRITGITSQIEIHLRHGELGVTVNHQQQFWDFIQLFEIYPQRLRRGYSCRLCFPVGRKTYVTIASLWRAHAFEPLLTWINDTLLRAQWLCLQSFGGGTTGASLMVDESQVFQSIGKHPVTVKREQGCNGSIQITSESGM